MTMWSCTDYCAYACTHEITNDAEARIREHGKDAARIEQFYGKWAFWRLGGIQEPASVAFSLLNLWAHVRGLGSLQRELPERHPMRQMYIYWSLANVNLWIWSAMFHTRGVWSCIPPILI
jgi:hypothetical protein